MSAHRQHRRRDYDDDDDDRGFRNAPRIKYRKPSADTDALFPAKKVSTNPDVDTSPPAAKEPPIGARVKFYNGAKRFGILRSVDGGAEYFLPGKVLPGGVGEQELRPATEVVFRSAPDKKGGLPVVVEIVEIKPAAVRTEVGTVRRWDGRWGMVELDVGGQWIYLAARVVAEAGIDAAAIMGARVEVDCTCSHKPAALAVRAIT